MSSQPCNAALSPTTVARTVKSLQHDLWVLWRLQFELLLVDAAGWRRRAIVPMILLSAVIMVASGCVPVLLGIALDLAVLTGMNLAESLMATSLCGLVVTGAGAYYGWRRFCRAGSAFHRSREELLRNLMWLEELLARDRQPGGPSGDGAKRGREHQTP